MVGVCFLLGKENREGSLGEMVGLVRGKGGMISLLGEVSGNFFTAFLDIGERSRLFEKLFVMYSKICSVHHT